MRNLFIIVISILFFSACSSDEQVSSSGNNPEIGSLGGCYVMTGEGDSAYLNINVKDTTINGVLEYNWNLRNDDTGTVVGVYRDSLLYVNYSFESEGITSVKEVIFKYRQGQLFQAFGELDQRNDTVIFRDRGLLQFDLQHPFIKSQCK